MSESITMAFHLVARVRGAAISREDGQTLAEYALILALIAVVVVATVFIFGQDLGNYWTSISDTFQSDVIDKV